MSEQNENKPISENTGSGTSGGWTNSAQRSPRKSPVAVQPRTLPPWKVLLHNDDVNAIDDVVKILQKLTPLSREEAIRQAIEAHNSGIALVLVTHQERAELYVEQFISCQLDVTAEPEK